MHLLFVCTGNICRSAVAERLALAQRDRMLGVSERVDVRSAGTRAVAGRPMDPQSAAVLVRLGGDPDGFRSQPFTGRLSAQADLVLTMTTDHRRAVLQQSPQALRRTFTLLEAADLLTAADLVDIGDFPLDTRATELAARLNAVRAGRPSAAGDDVPDPIGQPDEVHEEVGARIAAALDPLLAVLFERG